MAPRVSPTLLTRLENFRQSLMSARNASKVQRVLSGCEAAKAILGVDYDLMPSLDESRPIHSCSCAELVIKRHAWLLHIHHGVKPVGK